MATAAQLVKIARRHLDQSGPINTCVSNGLQRWSLEAGLPGLHHNSVGAARSRAKTRFNGWTWHSGMTGVRVGDFADWAGFAHVSLITGIDKRGNIESLGSGTPSERVAYQPAGGGFNAPSNFRGYFRPPFSASGGDASLMRLSPPRPARSAVLRAGAVLRPGHSIVSGEFRLANQVTDGRTVLYRGNRATWWTEAGGRGAVLRFQKSDGHWVGYRADDSVFFRSNTAGIAAGGIVQLNFDGQLLIKDARGITVAAIRNHPHLMPRAQL